MHNSLFDYPESSYGGSFVTYNQTRVRKRITPTDFTQKVFLGRFDAFWADQNRWIAPPLQSEALRFMDMPEGWVKAETTADELHPGPPWRSGGPFMKILLSTGQALPLAGGVFGADKSRLQLFTSWGGHLLPARYTGGFLPAWPADAFLPLGFRNLGDFSNSMRFTNPAVVKDLTSWGPEAWARTAPKIEMASGFVALAESRDIPHMLKRSAKEFHLAWDAILASGGTSITSRAYRNARLKRAWKQAPKEASESFLNQQFGWSPFLSDMRKFLRAYNEHHLYMSRMTQGNDQWKVYRRTLLDDYQETKIMENEGWILNPFGTFFDGLLAPGRKMTWEIWEEKSTHITTSGRFKWYRPEFDASGGMGKADEYMSTLNQIQRQMDLYGLRVTPSNIWRATPWTWLIDWGFGVGRNIDRLQEYLIDGVVSSYLYMCCHEVKRLSFRVRIPWKTGDVFATWYRLVDVKQRQPAGSPYGFDLPWENLSLRKLSILAALGLTRR